jgi:hypothetical protein
MSFDNLSLERDDAAATLIVGRRPSLDPRSPHTSPSQHLEPAAFVETRVDDLPLS